MTERLKTARLPWEVLKRFNDAWANRPEDPLIAYATDAIAGRSGPGVLAEACTRVEALEAQWRDMDVRVGVQRQELEHELSITNERIDACAEGTMKLWRKIEGLEDKLHTLTILAQELDRKLQSLGGAP